MIIKIKDKKKLLAIIIKNYKTKKGINFFTPINLSQQVAYMNHKKKYTIQPHLHKKRLKKIYDTSEVIIILSGSMKVDFYNFNKIFLESKILNKDDIILLLSGGHGFKTIKDCKFIEVKQGPYSLKKDKEKFGLKN